MQAFLEAESDNGNNHQKLAVILGWDLQNFPFLQKNLAGIRKIVYNFQ